ncbi:hypothetical protein FZEAL_360 [Fusarium zealandicum]|uniref:Uncharacterized protein n=1 Tax=Fusarium zealandicum TaxID=1053134 RepID=A0A8H4UUZ4_9HYPO|nr:hypothetical protein FZEAL_360 [Fusarium zealandicum]
MEKEPQHPTAKTPPVDNSKRSCGAVSLGACFITLAGSRAAKPRVPAKATAVAGAFTIAAGYGVPPGAISGAAAVAMRWTSSVDVVYSNADSMNQFSH